MNCSDQSTIDYIRVLLEKLADKCIRPEELQKWQVVTDAYAAFERILKEREL